MIIVNLSEKFALLSDDGYILHTEKERGDIALYVMENFANKAHTIHFDDSAVYHDERDFYLTENQLEMQFHIDDELADAREVFNGNFIAYLNECCGKNGSLTRVSR